MSRRGGRGTRRDDAGFVGIALGSSFELETLLVLALDLGLSPRIGSIGSSNGSTPSSAC